MMFKDIKADRQYGCQHHQNYSYFDNCKTFLFLFHMSDYRTSVPINQYVKIVMSTPLKGRIFCGSKTVSD